MLETQQHTGYGYGI